MGTETYTVRVAHARCSYTARLLHGSADLSRLPRMSKNNDRDDYTAAVGRRLAEARKSAIPRLSQAAAAEAASRVLGTEISPQALGNYEQGTRLPNPPVVEALCSVYGTLTAAYVLGLSAAPMNQRETVLLEKYRLADERGKYAIDRLSDAESQAIDLREDRHSGAA